MIFPNEPIKVTLTLEHLSIWTRTLPKSEELKKLFQTHIHDSELRIEYVESKHENYLMVFGTPKELMEFMYNVLADFEILLM